MSILLNGKAEQLSALARSSTLSTESRSSLRAMRHASNYAPQQMMMGDASFAVHNAEIAARLRLNYTSDEFMELNTFAILGGAFDMLVHPQTGLVRTSDAIENRDMSARQWVTDTVRCGDMERVADPDGWLRALLTLAKFYSQPDELEAMQRSIEDPNWYRLGGPETGVAHIFMPETLQRDKSWFNNKRLESHGLALDALCRLVQRDLTNPHVLSSTKSLKRVELGLVLEVIANLASYLRAINTDPVTGRLDFEAPSAGPWEEVPFAGGLTWDTEAMRAGFESLKSLIDFSPAVSERLAGTRFGAWLDMEGELDAVIEAAYEKIIRRLFGQALPMEHPIRPMDSSLAFISTSTIKLGRSVYQDVRKHIEVMQAVERALVRPNGMIRYAPFKMQGADGCEYETCDSYLNRDYWLSQEIRAMLRGQGGIESFHSEDCSTPEAYLKRNAQAYPNSEAEWFMVSVLAEGYTNQVSKLLNVASSRKLNRKEKTLLDFAQRKSVEFINRTYARITGKSTDNESNVKANGWNCPVVAFPEAYELVTNADCTGATMIPGADTPLAWAAASASIATWKFQSNLWLLEQLAAAK